MSALILHLQILTLIVLIGALVWPLHKRRKLIERRLASKLPDQFEPAQSFSNQTTAHRAGRCCGRVVKEVHRRPLDQRRAA